MYRAFGRSGNSAARSEVTDDQPCLIGSAAYRLQRTKHEGALAVNPRLAANHVTDVVLAHFVVAEVPRLDIVVLELLNETVNRGLTLFGCWTRRRL